MDGVCVSVYSGEKNVLMNITEKKYERKCRGISGKEKNRWPLTGEEYIFNFLTCCENTVFEIIPFLLTYYFMYLFNITKNTGHEQRILFQMCLKCQKFKC